LGDNFPDGDDDLQAHPLDSSKQVTRHSSLIVRNNQQNGLAFYTSVGTGPGTTHGIQGQISLSM
jgi:hypothetical protein